MDGQILPWRCAVIVALRPRLATLAGSCVWGDLPLSVRVYVHSYRQRDVWRWEVAGPGDPHGSSPVVATNRCHVYYDAEAIRSMRGAIASFCCGIMIPNVSVLFGGEWCYETKSESKSLEAH